MTSYPVKVANIAASTTESHLNDFFTFCGKIQSIDFNEKEPRSATINFEKASAAHTALMLNGGTLDGSQLSVTSDLVDDDHHDAGAAHGDGSPIQQHEKPRAGIAAEYLARGYQLSDQILQRAIEIDSKKGISQRFLTYFHSLDKGIGERALGPDQTISSRVTTGLQTATEQAKTVDEQKGISKSLGDYYSRAISSPFGQKVLSFYTNTSKQVKDIHEEARRIADQQKGHTSPPTSAGATSTSSGATEVPPYSAGLGPAASEKPVQPAV